MKRQISLFVITLLIATVTVFMSSCNKMPDVVTEGQIVADISKCDFYLERYEDFSLKNVEIIKRQTDEKNSTDKIWLDIDVMNADESVSGELNFEVTYGLYNGTWILDDCELDGDAKFLPLKGCNLTQAEIVDILNSQLGKTFDSVDVIDSSFVQDENTQTYHLIGFQVYKYCTSSLDISLNCNFDVREGVWGSPVLVINSEKNEWNIAGDYTYTTDRGKIVTLNLSKDLFNGVFPKGYENGTLLSTSKISSGEFFARYVAQSKSDEQKALNNGYSLVFDGTFTYNSFAYCISQEDQWSSALFIGKDMIAIYRYGSCEIDDYNRIVLVPLIELNKQ